MSKKTKYDNINARDIYARSTSFHIAENPYMLKCVLCSKLQVQNGLQEVFRLLKLKS